MIRIIDLPEATAIENNDYALLENENDGQRKILASNISSSGGGGTVTYYMNNGLVANTSTYIWGDFTLPLQNGWYICSIKDDTLIRTQCFYWGGSSISLGFSLKEGSGTLVIQQNRASMNPYQGSYRKIYCKISSLIIMEGQIYT